MKQIIEEQHLPCGCRIGRAIIDGERTFFIEPCSLTCKYYKYTLDETARQQKPMEIREEL